VKFGEGEDFFGCGGGLLGFRRGGVHCFFYSFFFFTRWVGTFLEVEIGDGVRLSEMVESELCLGGRGSVEAGEEVVVEVRGGDRLFSVHSNSRHKK
jgi:hypothetical protein